MSGSKLYDIISVANAAAAVASRNLALQKASAVNCISSQRTLLSFANPISKRFNVDLMKPSRQTAHYQGSAPFSPNPPSPSSSAGTNPLGFDRRPNVASNNDLDTQLKREYSTKSGNDGKNEKDVIGAAPKKDVSTYPIYLIIIDIPQYTIF